MESNARIAIKKAIEKNQELARQLERNSTTIESAINEFAELTKVSPIFIKQNLSIIRSWI